MVSKGEVGPQQQNHVVGNSRGRGDEGMAENAIATGS